MLKHPFPFHISLLWQEEVMNTMSVMATSPLLKIMILVVITASVKVLYNSKNRSRITENKQKNST